MSNSNAYGLYLTERAGVQSIIAILYLSATMCVCYGKGLQHRGLFVPLLLQELGASQSLYLKSFSKGSVHIVNTCMDLLSLGCILLLVVMAATTNDVYTSCSIFFIGATWYALCSILFSLRANNFHALHPLPLYMAGPMLVLSFGIFVFVQLFARDTAIYTYRATGALWLSLSIVPLFTHQFESSKIDRGASLFLHQASSTTDEVVFPRRPLVYEHILAATTSIWTCCMKSCVDKHEPLHEIISLWLVSLLPFIAFALWSMVNAEESSRGAATAVLIVAIINEFILSSLLSSLPEFALFIICIFSRFLLVLPGSLYWILGITSALLITSSCLFVQVLLRLLPSTRSKAAAMHFALMSIASTRQQGEEDAQENTQATGSGQQKRHASPASLLRLSFSLFFSQITLAISLVVGYRNPHGLAAESFSGNHQCAWAGLVWLAWIFVMSALVIAHIVERGGLGQVTAKEMLDDIIPLNSDHDSNDPDIESPAAGGAEANQDSAVRGGEVVESASQSFLCQSTIIECFFGTCSDLVTPMLEKRGHVGAIVFVSWMILVATAIYASYLTDLWVIFPLTSLLPISSFAFSHCMSDWEAEGCNLYTLFEQLANACCCSCCFASLPPPNPNSQHAPVVVEPSQLSTVSRLTRSWQLALAILVSAVVLCSSLPYNYVAVYLGLFLLSLSGMIICIRRWRATIRFDAPFIFLVSTAYFPTVIWSIMAGTLRSQEDRSPSFFVVLLLMATTGAQLLCVVAAMWYDTAQSVVMTIDNEVDQSSKGSSRIYNVLGVNIFVIKSLLATAMCLIFIFLGFFTATVSLPLGVAFCFIASGAFGLAFFKLHVLRDPLLLHKYTHLVTYSVGVAVVLCGLIGAISRPSQAYWWCSLSWLAISLVALAIGVYEEVCFASKRHYSQFFYPVFTHATQGKKGVQNVSASSSLVLIFFAMVALWGIWSSIIISPHEAGILIYVIALVAAASYAKLMVSNVFLSSFSSSFPVNDYIAQKALDDSLKILFEDLYFSEVGFLPRSLSSGDKTAFAVSQARADANRKLVKDQLMRREVLAAEFVKEVFHLCWGEGGDGQLSMWPLVGLYVAVLHGKYSSGPDTVDCEYLLFKHDELRDLSCLLDQLDSLISLHIVSQLEDEALHQEAELISFLRTHQKGMENTTGDDLKKIPHTLLLEVLEAFKIFLSAKTASDDTAKKSKDEDSAAVLLREQEKNMRLQQEWARRQKVADENRRAKFEAEAEAIRLAHKEAELRRISELARIAEENMEKEEAEERARAERNKIKYDANKKEEEQRKAEERAKEIEEEVKKQDEINQALKKLRDEALKAVEEEKRRKEEEEEEERRIQREAQEAEERHLQELERIRKANEEAETCRKLEEERRKKMKEEAEARQKAEEARKKRLADEAETRRLLEEQRKRKEDRLEKERLELQKRQQEAEARKLEEARIAKEAEAEAEAKKFKNAEDCREKARKAREAHERAQNEAREAREREEEAVRLASPTKESIERGGHHERNALKVVGAGGVSRGTYGDTNGDSKATLEKALIDILGNACDPLSHKFTDREFEALEKQLGSDKEGKKLQGKGYALKRFSDLPNGDRLAKNVDEHALPRDGARPDDVQQGGLGDCYFLSAIAAVAERQEFVRELIPYSDPEKGLYGVRFFFNGDYRVIMIDDHMVTNNSSRLVFNHPRGNNSANLHRSLWVSVVEKAYAKIHNGYGAISGGWVPLALEDLTGGIPETIENLQTDSANKWGIVKDLFENKHLLGAGSPSGHDTAADAKEGIVQGHAFSILSVREVDGNKLLHVRNPWGKTEWTGKWSDKSPEWTARMKRLLEYEDTDDGKFWISWEDFTRVFYSIDVCKVINQGVHVLIEGKWSIADGTARGNRMSGDFFHNPQYLLTNNCDSVLFVVLSQISKAAKTSETDRLAEQAYLTLYENRDKSAEKANSRSNKIASANNRQSYLQRDTTLEIEYKRGQNILIIPALCEENRDLEFTIRVYATRPHGLKVILLE